MGDFELRQSVGDVATMATLECEDGDREEGTYAVNFSRAETMVFAFILLQWSWIKMYRDSTVEGKAVIGVKMIWSFDRYLLELNVTSSCCYIKGVHGALYRQQEVVRMHPMSSEVAAARYHERHGKTPLTLYLTLRCPTFAPL